VTVMTLLVAVMLVAAGAAKLIRPIPTARALRAAGLAADEPFARAIGSAECAAGLWALISPSRSSELAVAATYVVFASFVTFLLVRRPGSESCGCAGTKDVPPSGLHLSLNVLAAGVAAGAALAPPRGIASIVGSLGWAIVPFAIGVAAAVTLIVTAVTDLPPALGSYRRPARHPIERDADRHVRADLALSAAGIGPGHPSLWPETSTEGGADG